MSDTPIPPWYKQFWPWFLLGLLFSSIVFSTGFAIMSIKSYDGMVVQEDYYEHGKAINMVLAKQERARELNLSADLRIDPADERHRDRPCWRCPPRQALLRSYLPHRR